MMQKFFFVLILCTALFISTGAVPGLAQAKAAKTEKEEYVPVPETIVNENVPPIPVKLKEKLKQYSDMKSARLEAWHPGDKGMIISSRINDTSQLYWVGNPGGKPEPLTNFNEPVTSAVFSPDPARNYFIFPKDVGGAENYQLFRYDIGTHKTDMLTDGKSRFMNPVFNNAGDKFAYSGNNRTGTFFDVYVMDPSKPSEAKLVFEAQRQAYYVPTRWLPDDRHLLVVEYLSANEMHSYLVDTISGKADDLTPQSGVPITFTLSESSNDGKYLFGTTDKGAEFHQLIRFERATAKIDVLTPGIPWDVNLACASWDRKKMAFMANEEGISRLYLMDVDTLKYKPLSAVPDGVVSEMFFDSQGTRLFMNLANAQLNGDAFELNLETMKFTRWTQSDTGGLDLSTFVMPTLIHYPTFDTVNGKPRSIPAFYYRPMKKTGKPYPVVINIHGGPEGQYRPTFQGMNNYLLNESGVAVIAPNVRGSSGYGKSYLLLDNWEKREDSVKDIGALLDWIAAQPELDKNRVAVYGGSYGGYMVLASMVHFSSRLACGVDIVGISNFVTFLENTSAYRRDLRRVEYGDERKIRDFLNSISPSTNAHKITKPLFVIQGQNDPRVPMSEAEQIVKTVRKNNVPVWYQLATNEGHGFNRKSNRDFMYYSVIRFFQEFLLK
jgi:dipeptidyl aminopeptidase/acylaminoacyl peptidase